MAVRCPPDGTPVRHGVSRETVRPAPAGASGVSFRFRRTGANNGYWVVDGVKISTS
jgi:hypothetical protein